MFAFFKNTTHNIGVDLGNDSIKLVQLRSNGKTMALVAGRFEQRPQDIEPGSSSWQRWAIQMIRRFISEGAFKGKNVVAAIPAGDVVIEQTKMPRTGDGKLEDLLFAKIKHKLPFEPVKDNTMIKYIATENDNVLIMATQRKIIDRHLAIYEQANLHVKAIGVWPIALANCYATFFGRRKSDLDSVVMLIDITPDSTNLVISRHCNVLFARSISIGAAELCDEKSATRLVLELSAAKRQFATMYHNPQIDRLIFLSGQAVERQVCAEIAKQLEMPAQMGDCLAAVQIVNPYKVGIDRRAPTAGSHLSRSNHHQANWATAFGLSLS